jgi:ADP-ribose pyrophosphatase YjhB (NUDIX family)
MPTKTIGSMKQGTQYIERSAVRVVVTSADGERVVIIKATKGNYYKLPGGGVEGQEDHQKAAEREVFEETGAQVSVEGGCFATVEEFRNDLHQISYCYRGRLLDATGKPELTEDEMADGLSHEWVPVGEALEAMSSLEPTSELGRYIKERDMFLLAEALKFA